MRQTSQRIPGVVPDGVVLLLDDICRYACCSLFLVAFLFQFSVTDGGAAERSKEMIAFGDSVTEGYPDGRGYEPELEMLTDSRNDHYDVFNHGLGGETTWEGLQRINGVMLQHPTAKYILLLEGTNDIWHGITRQDTVWFLSRMVDNARDDYGIVPILGTLTPDPRPGPGDYKNVPIYNTLIREMAESKNVVLAELYNEMEADWISVYTDDDLLHPNPVGYAKMAEVWFMTIFPCSAEYLDQCFTPSECSAEGGYWYTNVCNKLSPALGGVFLLLFSAP